MSTMSSPSGSALREWVSGFAALARRLTSQLSRVRSTPIVHTPPPPRPHLRDARRAVASALARATSLDGKDLSALHDAVDGYVRAAKAARMPAERVCAELRRQFERGAFLYFGRSEYHELATQVLERAREEYTRPIALSTTRRF